MDSVGDLVELVLPHPDIAQPAGQAQAGDQRRHRIARWLAGRPSASLTQAWRSAFTGSLKRSTCGSMMQEV